MFVTELVVMLGMIVVNSIFAGFELALASVSVHRLKILAHDHRRGAAAALRMKQRMEASLAVVQLGITLVGAIAAATGGAGAEQFIEPQLAALGVKGGLAQIAAIGLVVVPLTVLTIIFGELAPKLFALRHNEWVCLNLAPAMEWFSIGLRPAVWSLEKSVGLLMHWGERCWTPDRQTPPSADEAPLQELRSIASLARTARLIGLHEERVIHNAARLSSTPVRDIMLPNDGISMLCLGDTLSDALIGAHHDMHTRYPVAERAGDPQSILGYVNFKDIVAAIRVAPHDPSLRGILRPLPSLNGEHSTASCLERLIQDHNHIALVRDARQQVIGMVTLEDILEELVGDISDEYDRLPTHITRSGRGWIVGGGVSLKRLKENTGIELSCNGDANFNLNDWVTEHLDHPVASGETVQHDALRVFVRKERRQSVLEALVERTG